jgi:hypothetical protein
MVSKLEQILKGLVCWPSDPASKQQIIQAKLAILEVERECVPKKQKEKLTLKDYRFLNSISQEQIAHDEERAKIYNSCIDDINSKMGEL